jgi:hypothetical protein
MGSVVPRASTCFVAIVTLAAPAAGGDGEAGARPNVWFGNVEQIASERIGRETVTYVANIYKYYIAYRLTSEENSRRAAAKAAVKAGTR